MPVAVAAIEDIPSLHTLINGAYRGEESKKGWTTEASLLLGDVRTDIPALTGLMHKQGATFLKYTSDEGIITGCVCLQKQERGIYLGMLSVSPLQQAAGIGRQLMLAAEQVARENNCPCVFMNVISVRSELIAWYERLGYTRTGETKPMPQDNRYGIPTQPLEFIILQKNTGITG